MGHKVSVIMCSEAAISLTDEYSSGARSHSLEGKCMTVRPLKIDCCDGTPQGRGESTSKVSSIDVGCHLSQQQALQTRLCMLMHGVGQAMQLLRMRVHALAVHIQGNQIK